MGLTLITGNRGENEACKYLKKKGYRILERNFRKRYGEIDIIAQKGSVISFVEVKTRARTDFGTAGEAVGFKKQQRIIHTAQAYIMEQNIDAAFSFDIIEVYYTKNRIDSINHLENAFTL